MLFSNMLLAIDVINGAENITAYEYTKGRPFPSMQSISTIIILSMAIVITCMQLYTITFTNLRSCPTLTVFDVPAWQFPSFDRSNCLFMVIFIFASFVFLFSFVVGWGSLIVFGIMIVIYVVDTCNDHEYELQINEFRMWWIELNTAFYLPFVHTPTTTTATLISSIIDSSAEIIELGNSLYGSIFGKDIEIGGYSVNLRPRASESDIMWSFMVYETVRCSTTTTHGTKKDDNDNDNDDDTATNQDQLQRFANLIDFYSLDGMQGMKFSA